MKNLIGSIVIAIILISNVQAQSTTPEIEASQIAQKMKDTLSLSDQQKSQVEAATIDIQNMKANLKQLYKNNALDYYLFMAEESRDSLYKDLLPADKYQLFKQKKANIIGNN